MTEVIHTIEALRTRLALSRLSDRTVGFVPTMGALHTGHLSLIEAARRQTQLVVVSIFVNPIQFNQAEDFDRYPRTLETDVHLCETAGADIVFAPDAQEMYPEPLAAFVEAPSLSEHLCGHFRPGHFRGVATVVMKLFQIVRPDFAYFGEKDAQQLAVIRRMVRDLNVPVTVVGASTLREPDGLALSSRNRRLGLAERQIAPLLYQALLLAAAEIRNAVSPDAALEKARLFLAEHPQIQVEYLESVDPDSMQPITGSQGSVLIAIAAWLGGVRLIDNVTVSQVPACPENAA
jgi:pantoate--beta-alanine ligase